MKFLCIPCDEAMELRSVMGPDRGSVSLVYSCPTCGYGIAMHTNPHETQAVASLGVRLSPGQEAEDEQGSKCPFTGMLQGVGTDSPAVAEAATDEGVLAWTPGARTRLDALPEPVRQMARSGIEQYAAENGFSQVDEAVLDRARSRFGS